MAWWERPGDFTPLILDGHDRLYLRRYWEYEQQLAQAIAQSDVRFLVEGKKGTDLQEVAANESGLERFHRHHGRAGHRQNVDRDENSGAPPRATGR